MKHQISTSVEINASKEIVWNILTDFNNYSWNPFIKKIEGLTEVDKSFKVELGGMKFKPVLKSFTKNKEFSWLGNLWFKGIFDGRHQFEIIENNNGSITFVQSESFSGILVPLLKKKLNTETKDGFKDMNEALKKLAESRSTNN